MLRVICVLLVGMALIAGKGAPHPFGLTYDGGLDNPSNWNTDGVPCMGEDSSWYRVYQGVLDGTFEAKVQMCGSGGASIYTRSTGDITLDVISPSGIVYPGHDLGGKPDVKMRAIIAYTSQGGVGGNPRIEPGWWTVRVSGQERRAQLEFTIQMNYPKIQTAWACEADWNKEGWPDWPYSQ